MDSPTSIHMVPQKDFTIGACVVCGQPAVLKWHDAVQEKRSGPNWGPGLTDEALERSLERLLPLYVSDPSPYLRPLRKSLAGTHASAFAEVS